MIDPQSKISLTTVDLIQKLDRTKVLVFTNGCFDILHAGHIDYLAKAKAKGDILIVAINTDESIKILKGSDRPIHPLEERLKVLSAIMYIDHLIPFSQETPLDLIQKIKPNILVKGGDYQVENIVGANDVINDGGKVETIPILHHNSSSEIIKKLRSI